MSRILREIENRKQYENMQTIVIRTCQIVNNRLTVVIMKYIQTDENSPSWVKHDSEYLTRSNTTMYTVLDLHNNMNFELIEKVFVRFKTVIVQPRPRQWSLLQTIKKDRLAELHYICASC